MQRDYGEVSDWSKLEQTWNHFWRGRIVKLTVWRLLYNSLPFFSNLERKGCSVSNVCGFCGFKNEEANHLFFDCWYPRSLWATLCVVNRSWQSADHLNINDRLWLILAEEDPTVIRIVAMRIWLIWYNRNLATHEKQAMSVNTSSLKVTSTIFQYDLRNMIGYSQEFASSMIFFIDGAWNWNTNHGGWASVAIFGKPCDQMQSWFRPGFSVSVK